MKIYSIKIKETLERTIEVEMDDDAVSSEALAQAEHEYYNGEHILTSEDYTGTEFILLHPKD